MTQIPFIASLYAKRETASARQVVTAVQCHFPDATVDWHQGDEKVRQEIELIRSLNLPESVIRAQQQSLGRVAYIALQDDQFPGLTGSFYARQIERDLGDRFDLTCEPKTNIAFLKRMAQRIATSLDCRYLIATDDSWGIPIQAQPGSVGPVDFAKARFPESVYGPLALRPISDWEDSLHKAVPLWFAQAAFNSKSAMIERIGSIESLPDKMVDALMQIDVVQKAWLIEMDAQFSNVMILTHENWISTTTLSGAAKGILTS